MSTKSYLVQKAQRLQEIPDLILESFLEESYEKLSALFEEYRDAKKGIKLAFLDKAVVNMPDLENPEYRRILQQVAASDSSRSRGYLERP